MDVRRYTPASMGKKTIELGKQGENNATRLEFDCSAWTQEYPGAAVELHLTKPDGDTRNAELTGENGVYAFIVTEAYTTHSGQGVMELILRDAETATILKSATGYTNVTYSPSAQQPEETPGTPGTSAGGYVRYDIAQELTSEEKTRARRNIGAGTGDGTGSGGSGEPGEDGGYYTPKVSSAGVLSWTASKTGMPSVSSVNIKGPQGETGPAGPQGETGPAGPQGDAGNDGFSPVVKLARQTDGVMITVTNKDGSQSEKVYDGTGGGSGEGGGSGKNGVTFTPSVSEAGVISWTNDGGLTNPDAVNIKGPQGETGPAGPQGDPGDDGYSPVVRLTRNETENSVQITVTNKDGTKMSTVYDGATGPQGDPGADGGYYTPKVTTAGVLSWTASKTGMSSVSSVNIKGPQGPEGPQGPKPVKGTDYWTAEDKAAMVQDVLAALPNASGVSF